MPVDSFAHVADSLRGALAAAKPLNLLGLAARTVELLAAVGGAVGLALLVAKAARRLGRWKRYRWDQKPLTMFPADYRYKPDVFVARGDKAEERLRNAFAETSGSILIRGPSGVGKSSVLVWLLRELKLKAYMPTDDDLSHHDALLTNKSVIILDNLQDLKRRDRDGDVTYWLQRNRPRVIGLVPDEAQEEAGPLVGQFARGVRIEPWSESEGRNLAGAYGTVFSRDDFRNTALSVVAPESHMRRMYERECDSDGRAVLNALKIVKGLTGSSVPRRVVELYAERFYAAGSGKAENALRSIEPKWCLVMDDTVLLRDGLDPPIDADFSWNSDAWKNLLSVLLDKPHRDWHEVAGLMAQRMEGAGMWREASTVAERCLTAGCRDPRMMNPLGSALSELGEKERAAAILKDAIAGFTAVRDRAGAASTLHELGMLAQDQGELAEARKLYDRSLKIKQEFNDKPGIAATLHQLGMLAQDRGDYQEARQHYGDSLTISRRLNNQPNIARTLHEMGRLAQAQRDYAEAERRYDESMFTSRNLGNVPNVAKTLHQKGLLAQDQGKYREAHDLYIESLTIKRGLGDRSLIATTVYQLGRLADEQEDDRTALKNYLMALSIFEELKSPYRDIAKKDIARMQQRLGDVAFKKLHDEVTKELAAGNTTETK